MSDHYRRGDPETGCAIMLIGAGVLLVVAIVALIFWLTVLWDTVP